MCGIVGIASAESLETRDQLVVQMAAALAHRGPDADGRWVDDSSEVAFGHARLSILDLSELGSQPMTSRTERFVMVYNGEVYNFQEIRNTLSPLGHDFRGGSDTEVLLAAFEQWGVEKAVTRFNGMFAFAVWDRERSELWLGRDRLGIKPLYYGWHQNRFVFASELKPFRKIPESQFEVNRDALRLLLRFNNIPAPHSILQNIWKLPPGHLLKLGRSALLQQPEEFSCSGDTGLKSCSPFPFWNPLQAAKTDTHETQSAALDRFDNLLTSAVSMRMISDVPLGAFLSGGIDSSLIVALMQKENSSPVRTFSIGFEETQFNEAPYAKEIATYLGTDHTELYVTSKQALEVVPLLPEIFDEPFADASQIPTYLLSRLTRQSVTVSLSGDGGDELFWGYDRYLLAQRVQKLFHLIPTALRSVASGGLRSLPPALFQLLVKCFAPALPSRYRSIQVGDRIERAADILAANSLLERYLAIISHWPDRGSIVQHSSEPNIWQGQRELPSEQLLSTMQQLQFFDLVHYLPDDILVKLDRASMAASLEARVPLLDHRVVEEIWSIPDRWKVAGNRQKWLLRKLLEKYVPAELFDRPKKGFGIPLADWLRSDLRDWADALLAPDRLESDGLFYSDPIRQKWNQHLSGEANWHYQLWDVLMFQAWKEYFFSPSGAE